MRLSIIAAALPLALAAPAAEMAPLMVPRNAQAIDGKYIVKFKDGSSMQAAQSTVSEVEYVYRNVFNGFSAKMTADQVTDMRKNTDVEFVENDSVVSINHKHHDDDDDGDDDDDDDDDNDGIIEQRRAPWGLARISSRKNGATSYFYDESAGKGVCVAVIDTGIFAPHSDFEGRATQAVSFVGDSPGADGNGHGTHCAGIVGSRTYGVAKAATLIGVKVLSDDGRGPVSALVAGLNYVLAEVLPRAHCPRGVVVSMSLGAGRSDALNAAVATLTAAGVAVVVAAGNGRVDACETSPASERSACAVGATDRNDARPEFSNFGACVDVHAPGVDITSTWTDDGNHTATGTSMAAPHVAGVVAGLMGNGLVDARNACKYIKSHATKDVLTGLPPGTANSLVYTGSFRASRG